MIAITQPATLKQGVLTGIAAVKANSPIDSRYERKNATNGQSMFNLKAANGERIGTSEIYSSSQAREAGIQAVKNSAATATIDDMT